MEYNIDTPFELWTTPKTHTHLIDRAYNLSRPGGRS